MATVGKLTSPLGGLRHEMTVTTYTSGAAVPPVADNVAIYIDLTYSPGARRVEIGNWLRDLQNYMREQAYTRPDGSATVYFILDPVEGKHAIVQSEDATDIVAERIAIGIHSDVVTEGLGSLIIDTTITRMREYVRDISDKLPAA